MGAELKTVLTTEELTSMVKGFSDSILDQTGDERELLTTYGPKLNDILTGRASERSNKQKEIAASFITEYLAKNPTARRTESGLIYHETEAGDGKQVLITFFL